MKIGIMQPYFLPYLGYFQLMSACDNFVVYDNIKFTKKGWIHRNRMLLNGKDELFGIPLKSDSDFLNVDERIIGDNFEKEKGKILGQLRSTYSKAVYYSVAYPVIEDIFNNEERNLFLFILNSIVKIKEYLGIATTLTISSEVEIDHSLKGKYKVIELCKKLGGTTYINPIGGIELYNKDEFMNKGITLQFHKMRPVVYPQLSNTFIPALSILDVMMFNDKAAIGRYLFEYDLL
jgi:hypothetical protein